jgi:hypothetical protein
VGAGKRIGVLEGSTVFDKEGALDAPGEQETGDNAQAVALSGNRIGVVEEGGTLFVKEGALDAPWVQVA